MIRFVIFKTLWTAGGTLHNFKSPPALRVLVSNRTSIPNPLLSMKTTSPRCSTMPLFHPLRRCVRCNGRSSHLPLRACSAIVALCLLADLTDGDKPLHYIQVADSQIRGRRSLVNDLRCRERIPKNFRDRPGEDMQTKKQPIPAALGAFK